MERPGRDSVNDCSLKIKRPVQFSRQRKTQAESKSQGENNAKRSPSQVSKRRIEQEGRIDEGQMKL